LEPERKQKLDDDLLETLLLESFAKPGREDNRISDLMNKLEPIQIELAKAGDRYARLRRRTISIAIAATLLLAIGASFFFAGQSSAAYAAIVRSLAAVPPTREYRVTMLHQFPVIGHRSFDAKLYLDDSNRFVVHHPGWNGLAEFWVGGSLDSRWIAPKNGPAIIGDDQMIAGWLSMRGIPSPYLHVTTILERLSRNYKLELLANELITDAGDKSKTIKCQHIVGTADTDLANRPWEIQLWVDIDSGVARRVVLNWKRERFERGPVQWTIELIGTPVLPDDWFELNGHVEFGRPAGRIGFQRVIHGNGRLEGYLTSNVNLGNWSE
jgi:hypothetical protein